MITSNRSIGRVIGAVHAQLQSETAQVLTYIAGNPLPENVVRGLTFLATKTKEDVIRLRLEGVKTPADQNVSVRVFINCEDPSPQTPITDPSYVGSFTFFDHPHEAGAHGHPHEIILNATKAFQNLYGDTAVPSKPPKVAVVTTPLFQGASIERAVAEMKPNSISVELVGFGNG
jgi:hypothetical protein